MSSVEKMPGSTPTEHLHHPAHASSINQCIRGNPNLQKNISVFSESRKIKFLDKRGKREEKRGGKVGANGRNGRSGAGVRNSELSKSFCK